MAAGELANKTNDAAAELRKPNDQIPWSDFIKGAAVVVLVALLVAAYSKYFGAKSELKFVFVAAIGGILGLTEILGRYTDSPIAALKSRGAVFYIVVNALASVIALYLLLEFASDVVTNPISQVLLAGLGAMAFLRSSIFKVKIADEEVAVGPAIILDTLLKFADAQVDRGRAEDRAARIAEVLQSLPLAQAGADLPRLCFALMQNLPIDVRQRLLDDITLIVTDTKRSEPVKVLEIGLVLWSRVGIGTLMGAAALLRNSSLADQIQGGSLGTITTPAHAIVPPPPQGSPGDLLAEIQKQLAQDRQAANG